MNGVLDKINSIIWGKGLVFLLLFTGIIYTFKLGFIQLKSPKFLVRSIRSGENSGSGSSQLKTVCMSLGTAMGTGNITGVAAALAIGGAGSIFWMWVSAFIGMSLVYAENYLSVIYSSEDECGPMAYISNGIGSRILASLFAVMCLAASFGMGGMVQVSSFADSLGRCFSFNKYIFALAIFCLIFLIVSGGAARIGNAAQMLLPAASVSYVLISAAVIIKHHSELPRVMTSIFGEALGIRQAVGGGIGTGISTAISVGIRRGIFSNEAGLGSSPILHSAAESDSPKLQGMWAMFEVFFDTIICCTLTALAILSSSSELSLSAAFETILGRKTDIFLAFELAVFAFCTVIGWYYCGERAFRYLHGGRSSIMFAVIFAAASSSGAILRLKTVWTLSDIFNGAMAFPNLLALLLLIKKVEKE